MLNSLLLELVSRMILAEVEPYKLMLDKLITLIVLVGPDLANMLNQKTK